MIRTVSGRWRARNMISTAPMNGIQVITESTGKRVTSTEASWTHQMRPHQQQQDTERDAVNVVLRLARLQPAQRVAGAQRGRAEDVDEAVHDVAVDPADRSRQAEQDDAIEAGIHGVEAVTATCHE